MLTSKCDSSQMLYCLCRFVKWQCNDGEVKHMEATLQAFSHFSNKHMQSRPVPEQGVVVDIQGVQSGNTFTLTDPAIHCTSDKRRFGDTNMGEQGIKSFFMSHSCNTLCNKLGLV
jgi:elongation factor 2 kinase